ncbi:dehydrogenase/oxidoreductase [Caldovatus sediminis]|uniref:Dehydrogenase/oxidoreductase n=1 Tax=Caldovatus sediminis TaxID=2041189 RepID=A0A8J2ZFS6_9PROT|nr:NAD(P)-dependent oxidoreductase [Caldovatus sediminis]GGG51254.1 dehydrogenase/oxidoreductase [Caldovatus sediminis]
MSGTTERPVGLIGLGIMGSAMSANLIAAGFTVVGHDIAAPAMEAFARAGGRPARSAAEVAAQAEIVLTSLPSTAALHAVVEEIARAPGACRILPETSTFPLEDKERARQALEAAGVVMLDCPLSGSGSQARVRDVLVYASGPREAYDRCLPVFRGFSRAPHFLGAFGNGMKMKFVANLLVAVHTAAAGEAFALARKAGLDPAQMFEVVSDGAGGSRALQVRGRMLIEDRYLPVETMPLELWRKDMRAIADFASALACPTPMFSATVPLFNAAVASGLGDQDTAAVCAVIETMAGVRRPGAG